MGLFSAVGKIVASPIIVADTIIKDIKGTTAVACHNLGRQFICVEKDEEYFNASVKRLEQAKKNQFLF